MKRSLFYLLTALLFISSSGFKNAHSQDTIRQKIDSIAASYLSRPHNVGLMVGIFRQRSNPNIPPVPEFYGYGHIRNDTTYPAPDSLTMFKLGSVGKTFTATMLAYLMQFNLSPVALLDRINEYLPDTLNIPVWVSGNDTTYITLGDLAMHYSSLPDQPANFVHAPDYTIQKMFEFINSYTLPHKPGTSWLYSNTGFGLLGIIESIISGQSYVNLSDRVITDSLGMTDTRMSLTPLLQSRLALGYNHNTGALDTAATSPAFYGAGGHYSSMKDMMHYLNYNMGFVDNSLKVLLDTLHKERRHAFNDTVSWQGLAWQMNYIYHNQSQEKFIWKDGATSGYSTYICWLPKTRSGVVVLSNSTDDVDAFAVSMLRVLNPLETVGIQQISTEIPGKFSLYQNYPNPFNPSTTIKFEIPLMRGAGDVSGRGASVNLSVYNSLGQEVAVLFSGHLQPGTYEYTFDAGKLSSGIYYYRLKANEVVSAKKMMLLK